MTLKNQAIQTALEGNWQNAIAINKSLIKENPEDMDALNRLALAYSITGKLKEAKAAYQKVINLDPLNPIALRNLKKLKEKRISFGNGNQNTQINNKFLEEPGKTKVVELVNIAQPKFIESLRTGQSVELSVKRLKIFISEEKQYIGVLPDDIARRLIRFIKNGCIYEAYIKSANPHRVTVFVKEIKKTTKFKDHPSFTSISESPLEIDKGGKFRERVEEERLKKPEQAEDEEENYSEDLL
ncbi:MAG: tetratricopeptide repeat protein [Patescibacteria group bacterium]